jgi:dimeric dUTPase (all-alpha-NTP-PPase superfamily)
LSKLNLQEIWNLQRELNIMIGRDTVGDPEKEKWFHDYAVALHDEATELFNCCNWKWWSIEGQQDQYKKIIDLKNAKIEVIDCLHFLISLMHIVDYDLQRDLEDFEDTFERSKSFEERYFSNFSQELITKSANWMRTTNIIIEEKHRENTAFEIYTSMLTLLFIFNILGFKSEDILKIYKMKHEKNVLRQQNNYSVIGKTENDNNEIKAKI